MPELKTYPTTNQKVSIIVEDERHPALQISAVVDSVMPDGRLELLLPEEQASDQVRLDIPVVVEYGCGKLAYRMVSSIEDIMLRPGRHEGKSVSLVVLRPPHDLRKIERRRFLRLYISLPARFEIVSLPAGFDECSSLRKQTLAAWNSELDCLEHTARIGNLSVTGVYMVTETPLAEWSEVLLEIQEPGLPLRLVGRVAWSNQSQLGGVCMHQAGVGFVGIEEEEQRQILQFICQEEQRRRRLLHKC
ncbi:MAG: hypothetical protein D6791_01250 [Chloroflexi bacterium]|nr:MAG: hypothetical protein D6791_01250 [Chloroflexota bacterium]